MPYLLEPISIATQGYVGLGPDVGEFCPRPLAIATHGYVRFVVGPARDPFGGGKGHGRVIQPPRQVDKPESDTAKKALLAVIAIESYYDD